MAKKAKPPEIPPPPYTLESLRGLYLSTLRAMARSRFGKPSSWTVGAKKEELVLALYKGERPQGLPAPTPKTESDIERNIRRIVREEMAKERK